MPLSTPVRLGFIVAYSIRWLSLSCLLVTVPLLSGAQGRATVSGMVGSDTNHALEFATVTLHRATDSVGVKTEFTDKAGVFRLEAVSGIHYLISVAQVGFKRQWSPVFTLPATGIALPAIVLAANKATSLQEVTIAGRKPLFEHLADRTIVNIAESSLAAGSTTLDMLSRAPNVTVDANDNLALRGRQGLLVVLDGKRVPLAGNELADYLRALPADQVQSIELITNPPASFDAQGGAGVIAINLKKDQRLGTNGSVNASYGRGEYGKFLGGLALNYRRKKFNIYGNYAYVERRGFIRLDLDRHFAATPSALATSSLQSSKQLSLLRSHSAKVGLDLTLSKRTLLGVSVTGLASQTTNSTDSYAQFFDAVGSPSSRFTSAAAQKISRPNGSVNLNLRHAFADSATARTISADADYARYHTSRLLNLNTYYEAPMQSTSLFTGDQRSNVSIGTAKVDYSQPLPHRARLEAGAKVTQVVSDNDALFTTTVDGTTTPNADISKPFSYHENVNAAYAILRGTVLKTAVQAGLRAEQANISAEQADITLRNQHYFQLFPSVLLQRSLSKDHALALTVARRIDRPSFSQVNPLRAYFDFTSYTTGNYTLTAQTSYNFEVSHTYKGKFVTTLAYARTNQPIVIAQQPAPGESQVVISQYVNLATENFYTLNLTAPVDLTKWWTLYANALVYYDNYQGQLNGTTLNRGRLSYNLTANNSFVLPHGWTAELNGLYESRNVGGFQVIQDRGQVGAGLQKSFWNKQGTLRLNVTDIFYTTPLRVTSTYDNFSETFYRREDLRVVTAALTYRFGNSKVAAARKRAAGADDELRRATGGL